MANRSGGVALTGQCAFVVKGHQGPGGVLTESGGCLGAVETKATHVMSQEACPEMAPTFPAHLLHQTVFLGMDSGSGVWEDMGGHPYLNASDSHPSPYPFTPEHVTDMVGTFGGWNKRV